MNVFGFFERFDIKLYVLTGGELRPDDLASLGACEGLQSHSVLGGGAELSQVIRGGAGSQDHFLHRDKGSQLSDTVQLHTMGTFRKIPTCRTSFSGSTLPDGNGQTVCIT